MGESRETKTDDSRAPDIRWLIVGALAGLVAAGYGILRQADLELPENAVARVNDQVISREHFERAFARTRREVASDAEGAWVLQRLVDDELLVQRALELGMAQSDTAVRTAIINSLVASVTAEADAASPSDEELGQYLVENADRFSYVASISVAAWQSDNESVAQTFVNSLRNDGSLALSDAIGELPGLPEGLTSVEDLRDHFGPGITAAAADMPIGSSAVFARRGRWLVVQVRDKESAAVADLNMIRNRVLLDFRRSLAEQTLREYLDDLRRRADVVVTRP